MTLNLWVHLLEMEPHIRKYSQILPNYALVLICTFLFKATIVFGGKIVPKVGGFQKSHDSHKLYVYDCLLLPKKIAIFVC